MKRLLINIVILSFIGWLGYFVIYPMIYCWVQNGTWMIETRVCNMGTYYAPNTGTTPEPSKPTPTQPATTTQPAVNKKYKDLVEVTSDISKPFKSPLVIEGKARGQWFFEASFPIVIVDWDGVIIGEGHAEATSDWMTTEYVPFKATVSYVLPANTPYKRGAIILKKDNPSGMSENDDAFELPVLFQ